MLVRWSKIWSSLEYPPSVPNFWFIVFLNRLAAGLKGTRDSPLWLWGVQAMKFLFIDPNRLSHSSNHSWLGVQCPCNPVHTVTCNLYCYNWFKRWPSSKFHLNPVTCSNPTYSATCYSCLCIRATGTTVPATVAFYLPALLVLVPIIPYENRGKKTVEYYFFHGTNKPCWTVDVTVSIRTNLHQCVFIYAQGVISDVCNNDDSCNTVVLHLCEMYYFRFRGLRGLETHACLMNCGKWLSYLQFEYSWSLNHIL